MENHRYKYGLGVLAKSNISGIKGIITSRSEHLNGCDRYWVAPKANKDGKLPEGMWFDEGEVVILKSKRIKRSNPNRGGFPSRIK